MLSGKKLLIIGDRHGADADEIAARLRWLGCEAVYSTTECSRCSAFFMIDPMVQQAALDAAHDYGAENLAAVLGAPDAETVALYRETFSAGDPSFAGPLAGVALGIAVFHIDDATLRE